MASRVAAIHRVVDEGDAGELRYVASRLIGRVRLVTGTAAIGLANSSVRQLSEGLDVLRLAVIMLLALTALVAWLIVAHNLWEKPDRETPAGLQILNGQVDRWSCGVSA